MFFCFVSIFPKSGAYSAAVVVGSCQSYLFFFVNYHILLLFMPSAFSIELFHISTWWDWHGISGSYKYKSRYHMSFHFDSQKSVTFSCVVLIWFLLMFLSCRDLDADIITFFDLCFFNMYGTNFISGIKSAIPHSNLTLYKKYSKQMSIS